MFNGQLFPFQEEHKNNLLAACKSHKKLVLRAPTGSGKTVLVTSFIDDYLDENPDTVFIWLCPGAGSLQDQSRSVFERLTAGINTGSIYDFIAEYHPEGNVYFVNWEKIAKKTAIALKEGEDKNLLDRIIECRMANTDFFMIIDEEHLNQKAAEMYESDFKPAHVLRISASPKTKTGYVEKVSDDEVIASGLIASGISINEGLTIEAALNDNYVDDLLLLRMADEKRKEILSGYQARNLNIRPLVLIQFPNGSDEWIARIKSELSRMGYTEKNGLVTSWFSGDHPDDPDEIRKLNGKYAFLLFKQAIATGWDCPRAKILVKLREGTSETFDIQTIGRIRRMPERHHYESELLDHCYVYTLDEKFTEGLTTEISSSFYTARYLKKAHAPAISLEREFLPESDRQAVDEEAVVKALRAKLLQECDIDQNGFLSKRELELTKGFTFGIRLKTRAVEGIARTTSDLTNLQAIFCGEHEIDMHDDGFLIRDAKRKIARSVGIDENICSKALSVLFDSSRLKVPFTKGAQISLFSDFDKQLDLQYKVMKDTMGHREYSAFLVNNWEILAEMLGEIDKSGIVLTDAETEVSDWTIPKMQDYKKHRDSKTGQLLQKNVFEGYGADILVQPNRSEPEIKFEQWCEINDAVEWVYKNGDKGQDYFTVVYRVAFRRYNFYPDYILKMKNGDVWIIETKGGAAADGTTQNIDKYAAQKFAALKKYGAEHPEVKWGFVRNLGIQLFISTTEWDEDLFNHDVWKPIGDVVR